MSKNEERTAKPTIDRKVKLSININNASNDNIEK